MPTFNHIGGAEPSTLTFKVATVSQTINSSVMHKEVLVLGDPDTSNAIAAVLASAPASTAWGIVTRPLGPVSIQGNSTVFQGTSPWTIAGNSTVVILSGNSSVIVTSGNSSVTITAGNSSVFQASSAWQVQVTNTPTVTVQGNSSVWQGSSAWQVQVTNSPTVTVQGNSTVVIASGNSSVIITSGNSSVIITSGNSSVTISAWAVGAGRVLVDQNSTVWQVQTVPQSTAWVKSAGFSVDSSNYLNVKSVNLDSLGNGIESSTRAVGTNSTMRGLAVRQVLPTLLSKASSNAFTSSNFTIATSNAATLGYVYAYSITTTNQTPTKVAFYAGSTMVWPVVLAALSSAVSGVNLAVSPPAYLFAGTTGGALSLNLLSSGAGWKVGVGYWTE